MSKDTKVPRYCREREHLSLGDTVSIRFNPHSGEVRLGIGVGGSQQTHSMQDNTIDFLEYVAALKDSGSPSYLEESGIIPASGFSLS